ncbi:MAG: hypothetical protein MZV70_13665 [Desulfobacterales bacterium]|nr:hypothetical protein [Desulfobacterales bacterium]
MTSAADLPVGRRWPTPFITVSPTRRGLFLLSVTITTGASSHGSRTWEAGADYTAYFLLSGEMQPLDGRIMMLDLTEFRGAARIDIRSGPRDQKVKEALLRLYGRENPEYKFRRLWLSMTDYQRQRLAAGNVYPPDLLTEEEQKNILRNLWQPLGPMGVMDEGYRAVDLYVVRETEDGEPEQPVLPAGLSVEGGSRGLFLSRRTGTVRLEFVETLGGDRPEASIVLRWYGKRPLPGRRIRCPLPGGKPRSHALSGEG